MNKHLQYLNTLRTLRDKCPRSSFAWNRAHDDLRAAVDAFHSTDHIEYDEMLEYLSEGEIA